MVDPAAETYRSGQYDECLAIVVEQFSKIKYYHNFAKLRLGQYSSKPLHKCNRTSDCECVRLCLYLLSLYHLTGDTDSVRNKLES